MTNQQYSLGEIDDFLKTEFSIDRYNSSEQGGIYRLSDRPITRLGLALDPWPTLPEWVADNQLDAIWLHRPWKLDLATLPPDTGILFHHLPFDETLTIGDNRILASILGTLGQPEPLGFKQTPDDNGNAYSPRPIGMLFDIVGLEFDALLRDINGLFGGYDRAEAGRCQTNDHIIDRIAVVGAMNDTLIHEAHERQASLYLTGQYRKPAQPAVDATGIAVIAVGHQRSEEWGMRALADVLQSRWPALEVIVPLKEQPVHTLSSKNSR
ncbi:Nif3-like dinuclear metal center hexameric protein [Spirosoma agri]|uniref:NGG1p interacting factor NIF3 n=1 Tax=Spirosoma agri TaxID=1987381 RepID=A0A6M0IGY5_9BACT|nr:Nif3-like dinuclear metal center hexameric protein [Spirosoma agri]NEU66293.1 hypothetical protein [Spirosoma agri]